MYEETKNQTPTPQQPQMKIIQTNFEDNHSYIQVSGGNPNITIHVHGDKAEVKAEEPLEDAEVVDDIVSELKNIFWGDEKVICTFLKEIENKKPQAITELVGRYIKENKISERSSHRDLWKILYEHKLYPNQESAWNKGLRIS